MFFESYTLFTYLISFILIYNLVALVSSNFWIRNVLILVGSFWILLLTMNEHTLKVLFVFSTLVFFIGFILKKHKKYWLLSVSLLFLLTVFSIRNFPYVQFLLEKAYLSFVTAHFLSVQKIGLSYILFRHVHWLIENYKGNIPKSNFLTFINYVLFFPSILAGPIDTYKNFHYWLSNQRTFYHKKLFFVGISRIFIGAFKTLAIVPIVITYALSYEALTPTFPFSFALLINLFAYSLYIYFDFSGYSDIAIGTAYMLGIKTPENFNNPYFSSSLSEFWKRWHITFSYFLRIYVFKPFIELFTTLIDKQNRMTISVLSYLSTFIVCGLWHGDTLNFLYWGLWHGIGLSIQKIWANNFKNNTNVTQSKYYTYISTVITFVFVTLGWGLFHYSHDDLIKILNSLF